jgi:hypothetical protein
MAIFGIGKKKSELKKIIEQSRSVAEAAETAGLSLSELRRASVQLKVQVGKKREPK